MAIPWLAVGAAAAEVAGGALSGDRNRKLMHEQMDAQREFAQHGIQWKVADAKAAGIHPLYALGASTQSYSPVQIGDSYGPALSRAGQDLSREAMSQQSQEVKNEEQARAFMLNREAASDARVREEARQDRRLAIEESSATIRNMVLLDQLRRRNAPGTGPGVPSGDGLASLAPGRDPRVIVKPAEQTARNPDVSSHTAGTTPLWTRVESAPGVFRDAPNPNAVQDADAYNAYLMAQGAVDLAYSRIVGGPHYFNVVTKSNMRRSPDPGAYDMNRNYQRYGVNRKGQ